MKKKIAATLATVITALGLSTALPASPAHAAQCIYPTFKLYPGEALGALRYAEVNVQFVICNDRSPHDWTANVTKAQVNATGRNLGFYLDGTSLPTTSIGSYSRYWTLNIYASTCVPYVGWPCKASYGYSAEFQGNLEYYTYPAVYMRNLRAPLGMALFQTP